MKEDKVPSGIVSIGFWEMNYRLKKISRDYEEESQKKKIGALGKKSNDATDQIRSRLGGKRSCRGQGIHSFPILGQIKREKRLKEVAIQTK